MIQRPPGDVRWRIREADGAREGEARAELLRAAWHAAYVPAGIVTADEVDAIFSGRIQMQGSWTARRRESSGTLVAVEEDVLVGLINLGRLDAPGLGEVAALYVHPSRQGRGVGKALWAAGCDALQARGMDRLEVWTFSQAESCRFYETRGCAQVGPGTVILGGRDVPATGYWLNLATATPVP